MTERLAGVRALGSSGGWELAATVLGGGGGGPKGAHQRCREAAGRQTRAGNEENRLLPK
jgi:hypothetical protein